MSQTESKANLREDPSEFNTSADISLYDISQIKQLYKDYDTLMNPIYDEVDEILENMSSRSHARLKPKKVRFSSTPRDSFGSPPSGRATLCTPCDTSTTVSTAMQTSLEVNAPLSMSIATE